MVPVESTTFFPLRIGRHEIRQRFPDARSRFDDRVHAFQNAALDELRHLHLPGTRLEPGQRGRDRTFRAEDVLERRRHTEGCRVCGDSYSVSSSFPVAASTTTGCTRRGGA